MIKDKYPIILDFPLKGEWVAPNTPGDKVPSHGTDALGQRFAYDFYRTKINSKQKFYDDSLFKYLTVGITIEKCYCYREKIYSPVDGIVVAAKDGIKEPKRLNPIINWIKVIRNSISVLFQSLIISAKKINLHKYIGNYVIIKFNEIYIFFAHICTGTICVKEGQSIKKGKLIGLVGHTGNSTAPHLHFHVMDSPDLLTAKGIPCVFKKYEVLTVGGWKLVEKGIPKSNQRIRLN